MNKATSTPSEEPRPSAPLYVKVLVFLHIFCITVWCLPDPPESVQSGKIQPRGSDYLLVYNKDYLKSFMPIRSYLFGLGTWQFWDMFSPNPSQIDIWCDAEVIYKDGKKKIYEYPRIFKLPIHNKYAQERYRKFYERASDGRYTYLWPVFALRIAYINDDLKNPPVTIRLRKHSLQIFPPGKPQPKNYSVDTYYEYIVDHRELARMRKGGL